MSDPYLLTLHTLTLRQLADADALRVIIDQTPEDVEGALEKAVAGGAVMAARGSYMITPAGREALDEAYPTWFAEVRSDAAVADAIEKFETGVNKQVLKLMTEWQTVGDGPNDHSDADYDAAIVNRLETVHERTAGVLAPIEQADPTGSTIGRFLDRIGAALTRVDSGETDYVSGVRVDSFHTVWFQMHEHLLRLTGRERPE
jgi:hypothetical protein